MTRQPPSFSAWKNTEPEQERLARESAWQEFRCCRDCAHWMFDEDDDPGNAAIGACGHPQWNNACASFQAPEDYTCGDFVAAQEAPGGAEELTP